MKHAFFRGTVSEIADGYPACAIHFGGQRRASCNRNRCSNYRNGTKEIVGSVEEVHGSTHPFRATGIFTENLGEEVVQRASEGKKMSV